MKLLTFLFCLLIGTVATILCIGVNIIDIFKMKTLSVVFIVGFLFTSCGTNPDPIIQSDDGADYRIDVVDGCEYLYSTSGKRGFMAHKGNCNNPIHIYNSK